MIALIFFILLPDPHYIGYNKVIAKIIYSVSCTYLLNVILLNFLNHQQIMKVLAIIDPVLAKPTVNRSYNIDCRVYVPDNPDSSFPNIKSTMDIYVLAHLFGWMAKTLIFRNNILIWIMSVGFEILELSLK
jgi:phosphatidylserine synthase 2